ncbi:glycosyltransferase family A protein [Nostoc sp. NIES-2111]
MKLPLVSVVIPARNAARTILDTLRDVRAQTFDEIEIIVVDDGSNDETAEIVHAARELDDRIFLLRGPHRGLPAARNAGIAAARGRFIAPLDADDLWHPTKLARQVSMMDAGGRSIGLVYCGFRDVDRRGVVLRTPPPYFYEGKVLNRHLYYNFVGNGSNPLIRREALDRIGLYDETMLRGCEDYDLQLRIASAFEFRFVRDYLIGYRRGDGGMSEDYERMLTEELALAKKVTTTQPKVRPLTSRIKQAEVLLGLSRRRFRDGNLAGGAAAAASAFVRHPAGSAMAMVRIVTGPAAFVARVIHPDPTVGRRFHDVDPREYTDRRFQSRTPLMWAVGSG